MDHAGSDPPRARLVRDYSSESYFDDLSEPPSVVRSPGLSSADSQPQSNSASDGLEYDYRSQEVLTPITEQSYYGHASDFMSQHSAVSHSSSARMADFFGAEIFRIVLHTPTSLHQLTKFAHSRLCGENLDFLEQVDRYNSLLNEMTKTMFDIHRNFISVNAPGQLNLPDNVMVKINKDLKATLSSTLPRMESIFSGPQDEIEHLVSTEIYPRFVRHQMTMSATKALASDRAKYAGLGDCFVLTNPAKADNPIVYASDGFVKVTGYTRNDIIPRNCRFLQGRHTDRQAVKRIKLGIDNREESVELLLNYKKNGEPFWNLLYTTPLFNAEGKVVFFLGGQINCSTTIHSNSDIIRILSTPQDVEEDTTITPPVTASSGAARSSTFGRSGLFKAFRSNEPKTPADPRQVGMENALLGRIDKMNLKTQLNTFYSAYSKYLIVNYETMFISFYSVGMVELLYPSRPMTGQIVGVDVFRFLTHHASSLSRDFKSRVKLALKAGNPISLDLNMCTRRFMGFEKFMTHWTPLKDDNGAVAFIVLTMGSAVS